MNLVTKCQLGLALAYKDLKEIFDCQCQSYSLVDLT